jgi:hypothetical protein
MVCFFMLSCLIFKSSFDRGIVAGDLNLDTSVGYAADLLREAGLRGGAGLPHYVRGLHADCSIEAGRLDVFRRPSQVSRRAHP